MIRALIEWFLQIAFVFGVLLVAFILWLLYLTFSNFPEQTLFTIIVGVALPSGVFGPELSPPLEEATCPARLGIVGLAV